MDSMRRNAQKMMPHIMAMNKKPNVGMKNDRQPAPAVSKLVAFAKGGKVMAKGGAADKKQDKAMLARHNRLMHPGQKSKLKNGGMVKKYADGGEFNAARGYDSVYGFDNKITPENVDYMSGKISGKKRQQKAKEDNALNAYANRGKDYIKDKLDDVDVAISKKIGLTERAKRKESFRKGLKEEGYKKGGRVKGDKKKVMGTVGEAKAVMAALQKARRPATPMPGTRMAGLGMAPPMAPQMAPPMKKGGKVMKKAAGGAAKLRRKSPMPDKIKMVNYPRGG